MYVQSTLQTLCVQLSVECKDLLNKIFVIDAKKRISIEQIEKHPWWVGRASSGA